MWAMTHFWDINGKTRLKQFKKDSERKSIYGKKENINK